MLGLMSVGTVSGRQLQGNLGHPLGLEPEGLVESTSSLSTAWSWGTAVCYEDKRPVWTSPLKIILLRYSVHMCRVCVCVCLHVSTCAYGGTHTQCTCGGQRTTMGVCPQVPWSVLELHQLGQAGRPACSDLPVSPPILPSLELPVCTTTTGFLCGLWGPNLRVSTLERQGSGWHLPLHLLITTSSSAFPSCALEADPPQPT